MYILATFIGDDNFSHIISTNKLSSELKQEVESRVQRNPYSTFSGYDYFCELQKGVVEKGRQFPIEVFGLINVYLE